jgi:hypothetical protein
VTSGAWRIVTPIVSLALLVVCQWVGDGHMFAARPAAADASPATSPANAGVAPAPADARPAPPAADARPAKRLSPAACAQLKQRVERRLAAAQRCTADSECAVITFEYAFRPCGESAKPGAALEKAAADAKAYVDGCQPVIHPVRCAYRTTPVCTKGRCALTPPP